LPDPDCDDRRFWVPRARKRCMTQPRPTHPRYAATLRCFGTRSYSGFTLAARVADHSLPRSVERQERKTGNATSAFGGRRSAVWTVGFGLQAQPHVHGAEPDRVRGSADGRGERFIFQLTRYRVNSQEFLRRSASLLQLETSTAPSNSVRPATIRFCSSFGPGSPMPTRARRDRCGTQ